jgi:hypothetical protein
VDVRGNELLAIRQARDQRTAAPCADHAARFARRDRRDRIRTAQARERAAHRVEQIGAGRVVVLDQMRNDLGVGLA